MLDKDDDELHLRNYRELPIYKKAEEIFEVLTKIGELIPDNQGVLSKVKEQMLSDSLTMMAKIANAEAGDLYDLRMENAALIRKAARDLTVTKHSLKAYGFKEVEYFDVVRDLIEEFRLLFIDWVADFDEWNYVIDRWGLFNPPGVGPHDKDPDEDIPFNPEDESQL